MGRWLPAVRMRRSLRKKVPGECARAACTKEPGCSAPGLRRTAHLHPVFFDNARQTSPHTCCSGDRLCHRRGLQASCPCCSCMMPALGGCICSRLPRCVLESLPHSLPALSPPLPPPAPALHLLQRCPCLRPRHLRQDVQELRVCSGHCRGSGGSRGQVRLRRRRHLPRHCEHSFLVFSIVDLRLQMCGCRMVGRRGGFVGWHSCPRLSECPPNFHVPHAACCLPPPVSPNRLWLSWALIKHMISWRL